ncbi:STKc_myosinIII_N_like and MYSc_Myo21 domain-containing protein ninaC isoform X2 [Leptinotarsa decemlineata]|uniref:STKc_myosinIII_N_like and MYSc_Myo21 domain-containing protein ninaC isoform X2 n=1 Tax=Leptinotarsa decemlineata TaxID=7539 RepID=UPI003D30941F
MKINFSEIPEPGKRYEFGEIYGYGVYGKVYSATDTQASKKNVAIKLQKYEESSKQFVEEEYKILRDFSHHLNIVDFYGIYRIGIEIWMVLEPCEGGPVIDLVNGLLAKNRRMAEEHIAYVIKETVRAVTYLHENKVIHRDIKGSNILLTREGEVKLCDFGLSKKRKSHDEKLSASLGSPSWMAPEVINASKVTNEAGDGYDSRADVWSIGITAIELGDGKAPFEEMHPTRALFQIVTNPPPTLKKVSNWSENYHDFISECLVKNYEYRPYVMEIIEHPFLEQIPENNYHLSLEMKSLVSDMGKTYPSERNPEMNVHGKLLKKGIDFDMVPMYEEDLAALDNINERDILDLLQRRFEMGQCYSFIGDILLSLNPNEKINMFGREFHSKYHSKSRSDNAPHIYQIADTAYQNAQHHMTPQQIVLSGETGSGKTSNYLHLIDHLFFLGENSSIGSERMKNALKLAHSLIHASTPFNPYSTRAVFKTDVSYGKTGKLTCVNFKGHCLEKCRVSSKDLNQGNFHIFYYLYDGIVAAGKHKRFKLNSKRAYRYLRVSDNSKDKNHKEEIDINVYKYSKIATYLNDLEFTEEQISMIHSTIAAILIIGEAEFAENEDLSAVLVNREVVDDFADLVKIENKKIRWALTNYCLLKDGDAIRRRNSCREACEARDVLANTLYARLVDYVLETINDKMSFGKAIFGVRYTIKILDYFGFECFKQNGFSQLLVNALNEQLHYHFLQRVFAWELQDLQSEDIEFTYFSYYNNKDTLNELLGKPEGVLSLLDDASKKGHSGRYILDNMYNEDKRKVLVYNESSFTVTHFTGKVTYSCKEMPDRNRDFLPQEIIETMRGSTNPIISLLFTNKLDGTGNVILPPEEIKKSKYTFTPKISSDRQYSQIKKMRTQSTVFRSLCLSLLKELSVGSGAGNTHFVRCIRTDLKGAPGSFRRELVKQQIRAMAVVETAKTRQQGYPHRISFSEFLRRYKFLAFDFDENVEITRDNCRLLLIRLKMEGWALGRTKVFLKYHNEEFLSRLYETQVKKIIKIQSILRGFLVHCRLAKQVKEEQKECIEEIKKRRRSSVMTEDEAAEIIQKAYKKKTKRKECLELYEQLTEADIKFIRPFAMRWKNKSLFYVLMRYRGMKLQDFFNLSQQVHLYNMNYVHSLEEIQEDIDLEDVDIKANASSWLGEMKSSVLKKQFILEDIPFYDSSNVCDFLRHLGFADKEESWDTPYRWRDSKSLTKEDDSEDEVDSKGLSNINYSRDPEEEMASLTSPVDSEEGTKETKDLFNVAVKGNISTVPVTSDQKNKNVMKKDSFKGKSKFQSEKSPFPNVNLRKTDTYKKKANQENFTINSAPANKDFDYIKATPVSIKPKHSVDPIAELRSIARRESNTSEDDPPFNFQGMLRKTNFKRESLKNTMQAVRRFSLTQDQEKGDKAKALTNGNLKEEPIISKPVSVEILPGLIMEGVEVEL